MLQELVFPHHPKEKDIGEHDKNCGFTQIMFYLSVGFLRKI